MSQNETVTVAAPDAVALLGDAQLVLSSANAYQIDSPQVYQLAADELKAIKAKAKDLDDRRKAITKPLDEAKARVMDLFRRPLEILTQAEGILKRAMLGYQQEQERKQREAEAEARRLAAAEEERLRKEAEKQAKKLEKKGDVAAAEATRAAAAAVQVPVVAPVVEAPKAKGISTRTVWKARVVQPLVVPREYLLVDESKLAKLAQATQGTVTVPGVEFYSEQVMAAGR